MIDYHTRLSNFYRLAVTSPIYLLDLGSLMSGAVDTVGRAEVAEEDEVFENEDEDHWYVSFKFSIRSF